MQALQGIAVSPGVAIGEAFVMDHEGFRIPHRFVSHDAVDTEWQRLNQAIETASEEIERHQQTVSRELGDEYGAIFGAHRQMLCDGRLRGELETLIRNRHYSPEYAVSRVLKDYAKVFENLESKYLAERAHDIYDIERRLLRILLGQRREEISALTSPVLILAHNLTPSETANLDRKFVRGLVTEIGGASSHTAIMAGALKIPAVVGTGPFMADVSGGDVVIIDGDHGQVILNPDEATLERYQKLAEQHRTFSAALEPLREAPAATRDGVRVQVCANIEFPHEVLHGLPAECDGIGLYRTEFLYLGAENVPTEEDHYQAYSQVLQAMNGKPVVIRTLDLGADKLASIGLRMGPDDEKNPFLGLRSIRLSLRNLSTFRTQLRAVLRASVFGPVKLMFPLISTLNELRQAKMVLADLRDDLTEQGQAFDQALQVGMMVEVPAAALLCERFALEVDFFSIGTNDLIQYTLAVDRGNKDVASLYNAGDPSILKLINDVLQAGQKHNVPVSLCGQMSGSPLFTMLLLGLGLRDFSVTPSAMREIKKVCSSVTLDECRQVATKAMTLDTARDVTRYLQDELRKIVPELAG